MTDTGYSYNLGITNLPHIRYKHRDTELDLYSVRNHGDGKYLVGSIKFKMV